MKNTDNERFVNESEAFAKRYKRLAKISIIPARTTEIGNPVRAIYKTVKQSVNTVLNFLPTPKSDKSFPKPIAKIAIWSPERAKI